MTQHFAKKVAITKFYWKVNTGNLFRYFQIFFFFFKTISVYYNKLENAVGGWDPFWSKAHFRWIGFRELLDPKWLETFGEMTLLSAILKDSGAESICKVSLTFRLSYSMHRIELYLYYSSWMNQTLQWENILSPGLFQCQILRGD